MKRREHPIDSGWSWVILTAAFFEVFLAATIYLSGMYNVIFLEIFGQNKSITAWCAALHSSMISFMGPLTSLLINCIGSRNTVWLGTLLTMIGYISCAFVSSFPMVFFTYGFVAGAGIGLAYMPGFVLLGFYFKQYRNIAYGIVTTAAGLGIMVFAPLTDYLIDQYGYKGSMIITAGILANLFVAGAVLRPADFVIDTHVVAETMATDVADHTKSSLNISRRPQFHNLQHLSNLKLNRDSHKISSAYHLPSLPSDEMSHRSTKLTASLHNISLRTTVEEFQMENKKNSLKNGMFIMNENQNGSVFKPLHLSLQNTKTSRNGINHTDINVNGHISHMGHHDCPQRSQLSPLKSPTDILKPHNGLPFALLQRNNQIYIDAEYTGSHPNILNSEHCNEFSPGFHHSSEHFHKYKISATDANSFHGSKNILHLNSLFANISSDLIAQSCMSISHLNMVHLHANGDCVNEKSLNELDTEHRKSVTQRLGAAYKPLLTSKFIIFCVNLLFVNFGISCVYVHMPAFAVEKGSSQSEASGLLSVMGIGNIISRLITGLATNNTGLDVFIIYMGSCGVTGFVLCIGPYIMGPSYLGKVVLSFTFGLYANCYLALMSPITITLLGIEALSAAYGIELFIGGIGFLIGPPVAGVVYDVTGSYVHSLVLGGVAYIIGSMVMMLVPIFPPETEEEIKEDH